MSGRCLLAALLIAAVVLATGCPRPAEQQPKHRGDGHDVASYGFDLSTCLVAKETVVAGGLPRDGLPAMDDPEVLDRDDVEVRNTTGRGKFLVPGDRVIGVALGTEARAYPLRLLRWHEVVNDSLGGEPIVVTYSPLCDSVAVARRTVEGEVLRFAVSGLLSNSNPLLFERAREPADSSLWSQLQLRAVAGPAAAEQLQLELLPAALVSWQECHSVHPETTVLAPDPGRRRLYKRDPYHSYFGSDLLRFPVDPLPADDDLHLKDRVVAITLHGETAVYALPRLAEEVAAPRGTHHTTVGGVAVAIHFDRDAGTARVELRGDGGGGLQVRHAFWFAWQAQHPGTGRPLP